MVSIMCVIKKKEEKFLISIWVVGTATERAEIKKDKIKKKGCPALVLLINLIKK